MAILLTLALSVCTSCRKNKNEDDTPAPSGLYLGVVGFNDQLYTMDMSLLNNSTKHNFEGFVDNLTMQNGTILYHAVNMGIEKMARAKKPADLIDVSVVTFTDGLDQGSYVMSNFNSGAEYLTAVNSRILNEKIGGQAISAYSIGVRGSDVVNVDDFRNNLEKLSSDPQHNVFEVNSMSEASEKFAEIAQQLYNQSTYYNVTLRFPAQEPGVVVRFTFDDVQNAAQSQCYIQGTYVRNGGLGQLTDIQYVGLECLTGTTAVSAPEGIFDVFSFKNLNDLQGNQISTNFVKLWSLIPATNQWQVNSEFTPSGNTEIVDEYKSAMIMLVLDCSSSLGNDFTSMKTAANQFIETLSGNYNGRRRR